MYIWSETSLNISQLRSVTLRRMTFHDALFSNKNVLHDVLLLCLIRLDFCQVIFSFFSGWAVDFLSLSASNAVFVSFAWLLFPRTLLLVAFSSPKLFIYSSTYLFLWLWCTEISDHHPKICLFWGG